MGFDETSLFSKVVPTENALAILAEFWLQIKITTYTLLLYDIFPVQQIILRTEESNSNSELVYGSICRRYGMATTRTEITSFLNIIIPTWSHQIYYGEETRWKSTLLWRNGEDIARSKVTIWTSKSTFSFSCKLSIGNEQHYLISF